MASRLGGHFMQGGNPQGWIDAGARVFKFAPEVLGASSLVPPGPLVIGKLDQTDPALGLTDWKAMMHQGFAPEAAADIRFNSQRNIYVGGNKPPLDRFLVNGRVDVWEMDNEVVPDNPQEADWLSAYSIGMMRLFEGIGKRYALFNFAVGTPDIRPGHEGDIWPRLLPAVRYARDHGHYIALHEYMGYEADYGVGWRQVDVQRQPTSDVWHGRADKTYPYGWTVLRYRYIYDTYFHPAGVGDVRLLITECGCDSVESVTPAGVSVGTWKEHAPHWTAEGDDPEERYADMLAWYDARLREDAFVAGATVFTVGHVGYWEKWDIAGTEAETYVLEHIAVHDGEGDNPLPPPVTPPDNSMSNLLVNPSFEDGWQDAVEFPGHIPAGWAVRYRTGDDYPNPYGQPYKNGEAVKKHRGMLPPHEQDVFVFDREWTYKIFGGGTKAFWFEMEQVVNFAPGAYRLTVPVWVDHYHWSGGKDFDVDPDQAQIAVWVGGTLVREWTSLKAGQRHDVATSFVHPGGAAVLRVGLRSNWDINGNFWLDGLSLSPVVVAPPPPPPPGKHKAIVVKLPQDMTADEWRDVADYAFPFRHTITASHDDMMTVLKGGNAESYVKLAYPERQPDVAALITAAGYTYEPIFDAPVNPFAGLVFGQPLDTPWTVTSSFNSPRDYSTLGGKVDDRHEGRDIAPTVGGVSRVLAVADGMVTAVKTSKGYGKYVIVDSTYNGTPYRIWRAHMDSVSVVWGQQVKAGDVLGVCGSTGNSTGKHDHLTMTSSVGMSGYIVPGVVDPTPYYPKPPTAAGIDLLPYLRGDGRLYEVRHPSGATETFQSQTEGGTFWLVKNSQWEELYADENYIWRGADTSPGNGRFYVQFEPGHKRARWMLRRMSVGQTWIGGGHFVQFYHKDTCAKSPFNSGNATNRITFVARHAAMTWNGITVSDVVELSNGTEAWFYARGLGLVAWKSGWGESAICEIYKSGDREPLTRETINCTW